jgi:WD40 repeat protein
LKNSNIILAVNGDQNAFLYSIEQAKGMASHLQLVESHALYLDEVIDMKFLNENKEAILCSNSESIKLMNLQTGNCEFYPGHSDIVLTLDKFGKDKGWILSGAKDSQIRLWKFDCNEAPNKKIVCVAVFKGHNQNICSVHFAPKKGH